ncbi:hypothetical protein [Nonomuraea endophytica]
MGFGPAYHLMGFDIPTFVMSRIAERLAADSLIRPLGSYTGPAERHLS